MEKSLLKAGKILLRLLLLSLMTTGALAETSPISYAPVPDWVRELTWAADTNQAANPQSSGTRYLLYEMQDRPKTSEEFVRIALLMENENGVQDSGNLHFSFNAEFEELCLHRVVIHRNGQTIDRLDSSKVKLIQPERGLGDHMFTGHKTALLFVEDLRVGDVLEYAFTTRGANPALGGHYSTRFVIQGGTPVDRQLFRVVWEGKNPLQQRQHLSQEKPAVRTLGSGTEYAWNYTNLQAIAYEDYQPASYEPYPYVELSDFSSWGEVVNWAVPLYDTGPTNLPAAMDELIAGWKTSAKSDEEKARLALEFVQDGLRYTGIELGPDSYRPANPVETFQKRFGDCKGKVVLLRLLLQQMGIESYPALVNSSVREAIENRLPSPFAFNHVILKIQLNGQTAWVDPTSSHQGGSLWNRHLPAYGQALVIRPGNTALEAVPRSRPEVASQRKSTTTFTIKDYEQPAGFKIRTEYRGSSADSIRDDIAGATPEEFYKNYLNYYARLYSGITTNAPLKITDNRLANLVTIEESYAISNLWELDGKDQLKKASFHADNLFNILTDPQTRLRKTPLALAFPLLRQQEIIVNLPDTNWSLPDCRTNIEHAAFSFNYQSKFIGSTWRLSYECRTKQAALPADLVPGYLTSMERMESLLTDTLQRPPAEGSDGINWLMVVIAVFGAGGTAVSCFWYWRHTKSSPPPLPVTASPATAVAGEDRPGVPPVLTVKPQLQGLGGWLVLVGIGLCLAPFVRIFTVAGSWDGFFSQQVWQVVAMPKGESYHALYAPLLIFEMLGNIILFGMHLTALTLFFGKRRAFPNFFIAMALTNVLFIILDEVGCAMIPFLQANAGSKGHTEAFRAVFYAIIWSLYMVKSQRVKNTFTR